MPDDIARALPTRQDVQVFQSNFDAALAYYTPQIADALPDDIPLRFFKRVLITAINLNPDLYHADRPSLFNACVKCAQDGLVPDGQEAALVVFKTEIKRKDERGIEQSVWVPVVQYMPMIRGIRKRMRNSGEVLSAIAEVVYRNDKFRHVKGEEERIEHEPCDLSDDPGEPVGAYAIVKLANGEVLRDVMSFKDIEKARAQSRAKNSLMWTKFWSEGAKKTVLRRCAKAAPQDSRIQRALARHDEPLALPEESHVELPPPRPPRALTQDPSPAEVDDPDGKPSEADASLGAVGAVDEAGTPSETEAGLAVGGDSRSGARGEEDEQTQASAGEAGGSPAPSDAPFLNSAPVTVSSPGGNGEAPSPLYDITDCDGQVWETPLEEAGDFLREIFAEADKRNPAAVEAAIENNEPIVQMIRGDGHHGSANELAMLFALHRTAMAAAKEAASPKPKRQRATKAEMAERRRVEEELSSGYHDRMEQDAHIAHVETQRRQQNLDGPQAQKAAAPDPGTDSPVPGGASAGTAPHASVDAPIREGKPALPYEVDLPLGNAKDGLRIWALALLPARLRKCADKAEAAIVLDMADARLKTYTKGMSDPVYREYQAQLDAIVAALPG